jgi:hypothetical protein
MKDGGEGGVNIWVNFTKISTTIPIPILKINQLDGFKYSSLNISDNLSKM